MRMSKGTSAALGLIIGGALIIAYLFLTGCASERSQVGADVRAGIDAARTALATPDEGAPVADAILAGVYWRIPAATGVNPADWPAALMTPDAIRKDPVAYAKSAPPEPPSHRAMIISIISSVGAIALLLGKNLPGVGGVAVRVAEAAYTVIAPTKAKRLDERAHELLAAITQDKPA